MNKVIQAEQVINEINQHLRILGVKDELLIQTSQEQDDDYYYIEFNPFLMVVDQDVNHVKYVSDENEHFYSARVLMGFNKNTPEKEVWVQHLKTNMGPATFKMGVSLNEFIDRLNVARPILFAELANKFNSRKQNKVVAPVSAPKLKYTVFNLRDYVLNNVIMKIVPTDKGGAVLMANVTGNVVTFKYSVCSRDDKFLPKVGRQEAEKSETLTFEIKSPDLCYDDAITEAFKIAQKSAKTPTAFKQVMKLYNKMQKLQ